ncbi:hypothetical protein [Nocardioides bruguierae]|uniref:Uncharacterized protein n=1 Tax=Nocardioides bruguierae TaxID=2945102 RepID=A0A9X2D8G1_9ACTN|nr:hypothetical protein [Nocardioides bruguierae]MCM0621237.1 hypothetical protein [Nocardioides bruguierae]
MADHRTDDLFDLLREDPSTVRTPAPADVRRRGDVLRRRRTAVAVSGTVAAVVLAVGVPFALAGGTPRAAQTPIAVSPTAASGTSEQADVIPPGFPLTEGMPDETDGGTLTVGAVRAAERLGYEIDACEPSSLLDGASDSRLATYTDPSEGGVQRLLAVYADEDAAARAADNETDRVYGCVESLTGDADDARIDDPTLTQRFLADSRVDEVWTLVEPMDGGEGYVVVLVRSGRALLLDARYTQGTGNAGVPAGLASIQLAQLPLQPLFEVGGGQEDADTDSTSSPSRPAAGSQVDLTVGGYRSVPRSQRIGWYYCDQGVPVDGTRAEHARTGDPGDGTQRLLLTYADEAAATAAVAAAADLADACTTEGFTGGGGETADARTEVVGSDGDLTTVTRTADGADDFSYLVVQRVDQVGEQVLVTLVQTWGESSAAKTDETLAAAEAATRPVLDQLS